MLGDFLADVDTYGEHWKGVLIRRTYPELDEIIDRSRQIFRDAYPDAEYKVGTHQWIFKNGATLKLRHLENEADADHYQGQQYTWIGWDELTSWPDLKAYHKLKPVYVQVQQRFRPNAYAHRVTPAGQTITM